MRKVLTFLILALLLTTAPLGAVASPPEDEVLLGYRVVAGYYDIWKHNDGTWQATGKPGDTKTYESEFDFSLANISQEVRNQGINTLPQLMNAYTFTRASVVNNPPFGDAEYNVAGGYYGRNWDEYWFDYYQYRPTTSTWTVTQNPNPQDGTGVRLAATIHLPAKPLTPSDPAVPPNGPEGSVVNLKQWIEWGIIEPIGTPPTGENVEGWRYFTPVIVAWYGVPVASPLDFSVEFEQRVYDNMMPDTVIEGLVRFKLNEEHPRSEKAVVLVFHVVNNVRWPVILHATNPANALPSNGVIEFQPGEIKEYQFSVTVQTEGSRLQSYVVPVSDWDGEITQADWETLANFVDEQID